MNTVDELIGRSRALGVELWVSGGMLKYRAPRAAISDELRGELRAHKASLIDALAGPGYEDATEIGAIGIPEAWLAPWNRARSTAISAGYTNITNVLFRVRCAVDQRALAGALEAVARRHDALRCRLAADEAGLRLWFDRMPQIARLDLTGCDPAELDATLTRTAQELAWKPFADGECLFRPFLIALPAGELAIGFVVHHFIVDGLSFRHIPRNWMLEYEKQTGRLPDHGEPPRGPQYSNYLAGVARWSRTRNFQRRRRYWQETLRGAAPSRMPPDRAQDRDARSDMGVQVFHIDASRIQRLGEMAASLGVTLSDLLLAGVAIALHRELRTLDICLRNIVHGRDEPMLYDMIGFTAHPVVLRVPVDADSGLADVAQRVHRVALEAAANQMPGFLIDDVLDESGAPALMQTNIQVHEGGGAQAQAEAAASSIAIVPVPYPGRSFATPAQLPAHDFNLHLVNGAAMGNVGYLESVYDDATIERFIRGFERALEA